MISAFTNIFKIPELRHRIFFTLSMVVIVRIGAAITIPGVNPTVLQEWFRQAQEGQGGSLASLFNIFSGGALQNCAVFALGIMPYISASIIVQLLTAVVPRLSKLAREEGGRQKITQYTRLGTLFLAIFQGYLLVKSLEHPESNRLLSGLAESMASVGVPLVANPGFWSFQVVGVLAIVSGTMLLMWLGDQITERGIGNGISLIITVNILSSMPGALVQAWRTFVPSEGNLDTASPGLLVLLVAFFFLVVAGVICITQAQRRISIQYAKRVVGRKVYGGQTQYMPLKVNYAGVMPIIFAQAILLFPATIIEMLFPQSDTAQRWASYLYPTSWFYYVVFGAMIFFFSYFWVATMFQPTQIADDLKRNGGYIPGVRPGKPTADFLDHTMSRLTFAGAIFLTIIAVLPRLLNSSLGIPYIAAEFFGGTSVLIIVGVLLDTMRQVETHLLQRHYDGFLRKGRIRGRSARPAAVSGGGAASSSLIWLYFFIAVIIVLGMAIFLFQSTQ